MEIQPLKTFQESLEWTNLEPFFLRSLQYMLYSPQPDGKIVCNKTKKLSTDSTSQTCKGLMNLMFQYPVPSPAIPICIYGMQLELHSS